MQKTELPLAVEGFPFILFSGFATLILALLDLPLPALVGLLLTAFVTYFFRDPVRVLPEEAHAVICPADGKVIVVDEIDDDRFLHARVRKISIFMNVFNPHVNRFPLAGTVERVLLSPGRFYAADNDKATLHNEYCALTLTTPDQQRYTVVQIAGLIARRIVCRAEKGDQVSAGERFGMIRFGSRVDLYLPLSTRITVALGEKVRAGETVLGYLEPAHAEEPVA
ncbi:phosphatidylserine decarboxylase related protein [Desulfobulbus propionicus DSM 2032]|jgi:phosphatidylserine decarboxylase|uniref:Phosphatidylserine decarboxylase proenzyme n=1 Tax=Desulfobulbus propionicus (strain ATCC 33891 / DSM 2032 / VKM B-1956 / 1pr3) TaxID=577650 RepID=A0A7U3YNK7_DESPD|nr:phosphatidylserine decarboxylase family protein [Desulfobulbus propionicus]ADW18673.1 phosphatidylserine decarboxylase related protein [Desulfobulbus propionicus DSM 2032]